VGVDGDRIKVRLFNVMDSAALMSNFLQPLNTRDHPLASQNEVVEVYLTPHVMWVNGSTVVDVAFIVPLKELESGCFFLSCTKNAYVIRYCLVGSLMQPFSDRHYFSHFSVEPLSVRLFHSLNILSDLLRRSLFHRPESESTSQSFTIPSFPSESFFYLAFKMAFNSLQHMTYCKQRSVKYYNSLKMESHVKDCSFHYIRVLSKPSLELLREVLGNGTGLGLAVARPTKQRPVAYCMINSNFTYIDCSEHTPDEIVQNPKLWCPSNGIKFCYSSKNRILSCQIRFTKIAVHSPLDVTSRMATAQVITVKSSVFPEVLFYHNAVLYEVLEVEELTHMVRCGPVQDLDAAEIVLPIETVARLVALFGA
jgi:hypothetical protein